MGKVKTGTTSKIKGSKKTSSGSSIFGPGSSTVFPPDNGSGPSKLGNSGSFPSRSQPVGMGLGNASFGHGSRQLPPPVDCDDTMGNGGGNGSGISTSGSRPRISLEGNTSITEGQSGAFRLRLDREVTTDTVVTIRINDGSAICYDGDGSGQKTKGDLRKSVMPGLDRDFTCYDSQGRIITDDIITLTIRAGQTTSESIYVQTWTEEVSMGGKKVMTADTPIGEGNETFSCEIVDAPGGYEVVQPQVPVTIIDNTPYKWHSPLAIDLNGDGIKTLSLDKGVAFDLLSTGTKNNIGWISNKDGLLAVDSNGNGQIDNGKELFGGGVGEGFAKLDSFDTNRDGIVDANDKGFDSLKIWRDGNSNGVTDKGELQALSVFGINSLNVGHIAYDQAAKLDQQGNILGERGSVTTTKGSSLDMIDVYFQVGAALPSTDAALG
jgi:hypothetical protein